MKKLALIIFGVFFISFQSCDKDDDTSGADINPTITLSEQEETDLIFLREEEKLARDVYLYAYDKYGQQIHNNVANSEQKHMDQVLVLLEQYGLEDPASQDRGVFSNTELQGLYTDLTAIADTSVIGAYLVGATIEDLDIKDIVHFEVNTTKQDLLDMYTALVCGSRNHMRGYNNQLIANNVTYVPQFITQAEFDDIINGEHESCN